MRRAVYCVLIVLLTLATTISLPLGAQASAPSTKILTITPAVQKPTVDPGSSESGNFQIINQGQQGYPVQVYSAPYSVQGEDYTPDFTPLPGRPKVASWLKFTTDAADVQPGHTLNVHYTLTVPAGTQPGGYYAAAFAETQADKSKQGVIINERVGEIFYITVAGPVHQSGKLLGWSSSFLQKPPLTAELRLENDGGLHYASTVNVSVSDIFGHTKYSLLTQKVILPQTIRSIPVSWSTAPALGLFKINGNATVLGKPQTLPTRYVLIASQNVRVAFAVIIALLLAFGLGRLMLHRRLKREKAAKTES
jgi:hypothetical protein